MANQNEQTLLKRIWQRCGDEKVPAQFLKASFLQQFESNLLSEAKILRKTPWKEIA